MRQFHHIRWDILTARFHSRTEQIHDVFIRPSSDTIFLVIGDIARIERPKFCWDIDKSMPCQVARCWVHMTLGTEHSYDLLPSSHADWRFFNRDMDLLHGVRRDA